MTKKFEVKCPTCTKSFPYYESLFRPFCSEKCRLLDLGQWLSESYAIPAQKLNEEELGQLQQVIIDDENEYN